MTSILPPRQSLSYRLLALLLVISLSVSLLLTGLMVGRDYRQAMQEVDSQMALIAERDVPVIEDNLWVMDNDDVRVVLRGLLHSPYLWHAFIEDQKGQLSIEEGEAPSGHLLQRELPLAYTYDGQTVNLGRLKIDFSLDELYNALLAGAGQRLLVNGGGVLLAALAFFWLLQAMLTRHLLAISTYLKEHDDWDDATPLRLTGRPGLPTTEEVDELERIVLAINDLRRHQREAVTALQAEIGTRRRAEASLRESEEILRAIFEQAAVGLARIDPENGCLLQVNQRYCDLVGYSPEELTGRPYQSLTHPDDRASGSDCLRRLRLGSCRSCSLEQRYLRLNGEPVWVQLTMSPVRAANAMPAGYILVVEDIGPRRAAEAELAGHQRLLEDLVRQRTEELRERNQRLAALNQHFVGRELRRAELKAENKRLRQAAGAASPGEPRG